MTTALDSFRDPPVELLSVPPGQISNITGSTAPCGFIPDVNGNNAFFNQICLPPSSISAVNLKATYAHTSAPTGTVQVPPGAPGTETQIPGFVGQQNTNTSVFTFVGTGITVSQAGLYNITVAFDWSNVPPTGADTFRHIEIDFGAVRRIGDSINVDIDVVGLVVFNYPVAAGVTITVYASHDGSATYASPQVDMVVTLLGT